MAPNITGRLVSRVPDGRTALVWGLTLAVVPLGMAAGLQLRIDPAVVVVTGLALFALIFAMNSAVHSFLVVSYADADGVSLDVGFYYMANAAGRLLGTVCSGWMYQSYGLVACLSLSAFFIMWVALISYKLPRHS